MEKIYEFVDFLKNPATRVVDVEERCTKDPSSPLVSGHMLEDLFWSKNPHKDDIARYLFESNRLIGAARSIYLSLPASTAKSTE